MEIWWGGFNPSLISVTFRGAWAASLHAESPLPSSRVRLGGHRVGKAWGGRSRSQPVSTEGQQTTKAAKLREGQKGLSQGGEEAILKNQKGILRKQKMKKQEGEVSKYRRNPEGGN